MPGSLLNIEAPLPLISETVTDILTYSPNGAKHEKGISRELRDRYRLRLSPREIAGQLALLKKHTWQTFNTGKIPSIFWGTSIGILSPQQRHRAWADNTFILSDTVNTLSPDEVFIPFVTFANFLESHIVPFVFAKLRPEQLLTERQILKLFKQEFGFSLYKSTFTQLMLNLEGQSVDYQGKNYTVIATHIEVPCNESQKSSETRREVVVYLIPRNINSQSRAADRRLRRLLEENSREQVPVVPILEPQTEIKEESPLDAYKEWDFSSIEDIIGYALLKREIEQHGRIYTPTLFLPDQVSIILLYLKQTREQEYLNQINEAIGSSVPPDRIINYILQILNWRDSQHRYS